MRISVRSKLSSLTIEIIVVQSPDVQKVGHHGSAYSSTPAFVSAVHPRYALISLGRHNHFGHPAPSTLATLQAAGAKTYRTDRCGAITVVVDAGSVTSMLPCR